MCDATTLWTNTRIITRIDLEIEVVVELEEMVVVSRVVCVEVFEDLDLVEALVKEILTPHEVINWGCKRARSDIQKNLRGSRLLAKVEAEGQEPPFNLPPPSPDTPPWS